MLNARGHTGSEFTEGMGYSSRVKSSIETRLIVAGLRCGDVQPGVESELTFGSPAGDGRASRTGSSRSAGKMEETAGNG